jgi:hypothetical protein
MPAVNVTPHKLHDIAAFAAGGVQASEPNMEKARGYLGILVDALTKEKEDCMRYLNLLEFKAGKEGNQDLFETVQATLKVKQEEHRALVSGRHR